MVMSMSVAVMSGKGGVGKSNLTLNLSYYLAQKGDPVLLMDCDLGLANLDILLGVTPQDNLEDVLLSDAPVTKALYPLSPKGIGHFDLLPAASGVPELADMNPDTQSLVISRLEPILANYKFVMLDLGAGLHGTVQAFSSMAMVRIIVLTPEPTSLTDAYAVIKVFSSELGIRDFLVIVNDVRNKKEEQESFTRLEKACEQFLKIKPVLLGSVRHDDNMSLAIQKQKPLMELFPESVASKDIAVLAEKLVRIHKSMEPRLSGRPVLKPLA